MARPNPARANFAHQLEQVVGRGPQDRDRTPAHLLARFSSRPSSTIGQQMVDYKKWMETTKLNWSKPRSSRLKAIDKALEAVQKFPSVPNANHLRTALNEWCRAKGAESWKGSKRNKGGIVEILRVQAFAPGLPTAMSMDEQVAYKHLLDSRKQTLMTYFRGKTVSLKEGSAVTEGGTVAKQVQSAYSSFKTVVAGVRDGEWPEKAAKPSTVKAGRAVGASKSAASEFVKQDLLSLDMAGLASASKLIPVDQIATDLIPIVSLFTGAAKVAWGWMSVAKKAHAKYKMDDRGSSIELGDPKHAFQALTRTMKRDTKSTAIKAAMSTASFTAKSAGTFLDGGTATGAIATAVEAAGKLSQKLFLLGREVNEANAANTLLKDPASLDFRLFETFPLLGCYLIRCATLSDILALSTVQFGSSGWMDDVERMKSKSIDPMRKACDGFIQSSLFEVKGMPLMSVR